LHKRFYLLEDKIGQLSTFQPITLFPLDEAKTSPLGTPNNNTKVIFDKLGKKVLTMY